MDSRSASKASTEKHSTEFIMTGLKIIIPLDRVGRYDNKQCEMTDFAIPFLQRVL